MGQPTISAQVTALDSQALVAGDRGPGVECGVVRLMFQPFDFPIRCRSQELIWHAYSVRPVTEPEGP